MRCGLNARCAGRGTTSCGVCCDGVASVAPVAASRQAMNACSSVGPPQRATISAGSPNARILPAFISRMRSQRAASFMKCVETKIVTPLVRDRSPSSAQNWSRASGSTPGGRLIQDQDLGFVDDRDGECQPLPDAERQVGRKRVEMVGEAERRHEVRDALPRPSRARYRKAGHAGPGSAQRSARCRARTSGTCSRPGCASSCPPHRRRVPNINAEPALIGSRPVNIRIVVVLPQPFDPRKPKISPRPMLKLTPSTAVKAPKRRVRPTALIAGSALRPPRGGMSGRTRVARNDSGSRAMKLSSSVAQPVRCLISGRAAGREHPAVVHRDQAAKPLGLVHVGGGDDHAHARPPRPDAVDQVPELAAGQRVHAGRRFVQDQQVRVVDQGAAQAELLPHAAREFAAPPGRQRA